VLDSKERKAYAIHALQTEADADADLIG
jgi:hypothetical protein